MLRNAETELIIAKEYLEVVAGEPRETETLIRGSERGRWKSTCQGNSLAAYSTLRAVRKGAIGKVPVRQLAGRLPYRTRGFEAEADGAIRSSTVTAYKSVI